MSPMTRVLSPRLKAVAILIVALGWIASVSAIRADGRNVPSDDVRGQINVVIDTQLNLADRRYAALQLLIGGPAAASAELVVLMNPEGEPSTHRAVAQALADMPGVPTDPFIQPLLDLLAAGEESIVPDVTRALARFGHPRMVRELADLALDSNLALSKRCGAVRALGPHRTSAAAKVLLQLIEPDEAPLLRDTALNSLTNLSGIGHIGDDRAAWRQWWDRWRRLSSQKRLAVVVRNLQHHNAELADRLESAHQALVEAHREVYRATAALERPAMLVVMLDHSIVPLRLLGIELTVLRRIDNLPLTAELHAALLARLKDSSPIVREQVVTRLFRVLADEGAAKHIAQHLDEQTETNSDVLRAYLLMMARLPQKRAVGAAIGYLSDSATQDEAAAALAEMIRLELLEAQQMGQVREQVDQELRDGLAPSPQVIVLLGQLADEVKWVRILRWLDHSDVEVKLAAARAVADSQRPLSDFHAHLADPLILPIYIQAATQRAQDEPTLLTLVRNKPSQPEQVESWIRALIAVAERVSPLSVVLLDYELARMQEPTTSRDQILSAAIGRLLSRSTAQSNMQTPLQESEIAALVELLILRAEVRMADTADADPRSALEDYQRISILEPLEPTAAQRRRIGLGRVQAQLALGEVVQALAESRQVLDGEGENGSRVEVANALLSLLFSYAQRGVDTDDTHRRDRSVQIVDQLPEMFGDLITPSQLERLAQLHGQLEPPAEAPVDPTPAS